MVLLDTNVLSALMRKAPDTVVVSWLDRQDPAHIWITAITVFEIRFGLARLPAGSRRHPKHQALRRRRDGRGGPLVRALRRASA